MKNYLGSKIEVDVIAAEAKLCKNAGIPNNKGTANWSNITLDEQGIYCITNPKNGWGNCTYEQMMVGVNLPEVDVVLPPKE